MQPQRGYRIRMLKKMDDPYHSIEAGEEGTIMFVDDARQIHVKWDNGNSLAIIPEIDHYEVFNPFQRLLNFDGMTDEQIEEFIVNTKMSYEIDASIETQIDKNGVLHEEQPDNMQATGWLSGMILGLDVNNNIGLSVDDAYITALRIYKMCKFDLELAAELFNEAHGPLNCN